LKVKVFGQCLVNVSIVFMTGVKADTLTQQAAADSDCYFM